MSIRSRDQLTSALAMNLSCNTHMAMQVKNMWNSYIHYKVVITTCTICLHRTAHAQTQCYGYICMRKLTHIGVLHLISCVELINVLEYLLCIYVRGFVNACVLREEVLIWKWVYVLQIDYVEFERHGAGGASGMSSHYFDLIIRLRSEQEHQFRNIQRNEYHNLFDFIK